MLGKVTEWPLYNTGAGISTRVKRRLADDPVLGSKPQIYISHKCDALLWVPSGLVLVAAPKILKMQLYANVHMHSYYSRNRGAQADSI